MTRIEINETFLFFNDLYNNKTKKINRQMKDLIEIIQTIIEIFVSICKSKKYVKFEFTIKCKKISKTIKTIRRR